MLDEKDNFLLNVYYDFDALDTNEIIHFFNHGYYPPYSQYEKNFSKYFSSLYHYMIDGISTKNLKILDIGCGRGGGTEVLKNFNFGEIHACDLLPSNISHCKRHFDGVEFKISDAMNLDYENSYFDLVLSVESSHCYENKKKFLEEVKRVLKPNGIFLYCDISPSIESSINNDFLFKYILREDITENVGLACEHFIYEINKMEESDLKKFCHNLWSEKEQRYKKRQITFIKYICTDNMCIIK